MKRSLIWALISLVVGFAPQSISAARIRWVGSIYVDANGDGLRYPEGVACGDDYLIVSDTGNHRIVKYTVRPDSVLAVAEYPVSKALPFKLRVTKAGVLYFLNGRERRIRSLGIEGEDLGFLKPTGLPFDTEVVAKSLAIGGDGELYVLDILSANVLVLDAEGRYQRHLHFPKGYRFISDVTVDRQGSVYILDSVAARVYVAPEGADEFVPFGESVQEYVNLPTSFAIDSQGTVYLVDQPGGGLALLGRDGSFQGRKLGMGWNDSGLYYPAGICISDNGHLFIADRNNSRVQHFRLDLSSGETAPGP